MTNSYSITWNLELKPDNRKWMAFTLLEMVIAMTVTSIVMVGMAATLSLAIQSAKPPTTATAAATTGDLADRLLTDLATANAFSVQSANDVQFSVPSRSGGAGLDTLRYQWTGPVQKQLLWSINSGIPQVLASDVDILRLNYFTRAMGPTVPAPIETGELLLFQDVTPPGSPSSFTISLTDQCAQWFKPRLHPDAISWSITRVEMIVRKSSINLGGQFMISIRQADPITNKPMPGPSTLGSITVPTSSLPTSFQWVSFSLGPITGLVPENAYCLVVSHAFIDISFPTIQYKGSGSALTPRAHWLSSNTAGSIWSNPNDIQDMRFKVYGTITYQPW
ncbi:MAG: prepilin-type N-terminal cleavage/methylation domain-containing protein [Pirellulaceae bacterium]|nr:prepilin-type N-terminal cleavage/methylation domain-containing protein [Pirellulaceae bacterium]